MNYETDELSAQERQAFAALSKTQSPPSFLEDQIVEQLKNAGVIRTTRKSWLPNYRQLAAGFAMAIVLFVVGALAGARWKANAAPSQQPGFILIVRNASAESEPRTPEEELARVKEYSSWAREWGQKGKLLGGEKLKDEGREFGENVAERSQWEAVTKPVEGGIGGYFLLPATDYNEAIAIARSCPHLKHGGKVELRQIERF